MLLKKGKHATNCATNPVYKSIIYFFGQVEWPGFEPRSPVYIIHCPTNWDKLTGHKSIIYVIYLTPNKHYFFKITHRTSKWLNKKKTENLFWIHKKFLIGQFNLWQKKIKISPWHFSYWKQTSLKFIITERLIYPLYKNIEESHKS
jgi:hypothetical protein